MEETIAQERGPELVPPSSPSADSAGPSGEPKPIDKIRELWTIHLEAKSVAKETKQALKDIRQRLSEQLSEMKPLLARPGRNGQWSAWLKERGISRATADRLVRRYAATLPGQESTEEPNSKSAEDSAEKLARDVWPRLKKVLTADESVIQFIGCIVTASGVPHEQREEGLVIFKPAPKAADELPGSTSATDPIPQPSAEACAIAEQPAAEVVATNPTSEALAAAADASSVQAL